MGKTLKTGVCSKCKRTQIIKHCKQMMNAKIMVSVSAPGGAYLTLNVFGTNVTDIILSPSVTSDAQIEATPFTLTYENNVVTMQHL